MKPSTTKQPSLATRVIELVENARRNVAAVANVAQVYTNYEIGRQIVEEEQGGKHRADYGKRILIDLSNKLTARFGRGWSVDNLQRMRGFYLLYSSNEIYATPLRKLNDQEKNNTAPHKSLKDEKTTTVVVPKSDDDETANTVCGIPQFTLSWSHYLLLMRITDPVERAFYEREATQGNWSFRQLERMYHASTFERMEVSKDKTKIRALMDRPAPDIEVAGEALKDPVVTEFLGIPDKYNEDELEMRIVNHLQDFMLELGKGFTFYGRQVRCVIGNHSYYADLAFYNRFTRSFFIIDLKLKKVSHNELGQMQTYINYFDRRIKLPEENPTVGILLTSEKVDQALVEMFTPDVEKNRIFVKQYTNVLPSKESLQRIVIEEKRKFEK
jgi:predicted nuclease of restriction endonuclease-like (RecB) superfamily